MIKVASKRKRNDTHLNVTLKLAYHRMFWLVSGKGQRRPFCPDDEWAGLTGHFFLPFSPSLTLSLLPSILSSSSSISIHPPTPSHDLLPPTWGAWRLIPPGDRFIASARGKTPQTLCNARDPLRGERRLKHHLYLLGSR